MGYKPSRQSLPDFMFGDFRFSRKRGEGFFQRGWSLRRFFVIVDSWMHVVMDGVMDFVGFLVTLTCFEARGRVGPPQLLKFALARWASAQFWQPCWWTRRVVLGGPGRVVVPSSKFWVLATLACVVALARRAGACSKFWLPTTLSMHPKPYLKFHGHLQPQLQVYLYPI